MEEPEAPHEQSLLDKLRNMWEFASLYQYIFIFGDAVKIDKDFDIEVRYPPPCTRKAGLELYLRSMSEVRRMITNVFQDLETECLKPEVSDKLEEIGLNLLKWVSSHRGLTYVVPSPPPHDNAH